MALASPAYRGSSHFFLFVVVVNFIATVLWSFVYFLGIKEALQLPINWILSVRLVTTSLVLNYSRISFRNSWTMSSQRWCTEPPSLFKWRRGSDLTKEIRAQTSPPASSDCWTLSPMPRPLITFTSSTNSTSLTEKWNQVSRKISFSPLRNIFNLFLDKIIY